MELVKKGSRVQIEGQIKTRTYDGNDGHPHTVTEIVMSRFKGELLVLSSPDRPADQPRPRRDRSESPRQR